VIAVKPELDASASPTLEAAGRGVADWSGVPLEPVARVRSRAARLRHPVRPGLTLAVTCGADALAVVSAALVGCAVVEHLSALPVLLVPAALTLTLLSLFVGPGLTAATQVRRIILMVLLTHVPTIVAAAIVGNSLRSLVAILVCFVFAAGLLILVRAVLHEICAPRSWWGWPVAVLGDDPQVASRIIRVLRLHGEMGLKPVVILRDSRQGRIASDLDFENGPRLRVVYGPGAVERLRRFFGIAHVVRMSASGRELLLLRTEVADACFAKMSLFRRLAPLIGIEPIRVDRPVRRSLAKRSLDLIATSAGMLIVVPVMAVIAVLVKLDSTGPIVFRQKRPGKDGLPFRILKFRTMHVGAARMQKKLSPELLKEFETYGKITKDPRVTRVGQYLRCTSLDELPQLINVLRGEMSLVGPRPHLMYQRADLVARHSASLRATPGLTGLWQISGRSTIPFELRLAMDAYYAEVANLWLDLYILARTVLVVVTGKGAY
jgi:lipopolysaccharide/colanic/teichoic acid biosynthesis glycosyltransferase